MRQPAPRPPRETLAQLRLTLSIEEIAAQFSVSSRLVEQWTRAYKLPSVRKHAAPDKEQLSALYATHSDEEIGEMLNVSYATVARWRNAVGIASRPRGPRRGERYNHAYSKEQFVAAAASSLSVSEMRKRLGLRPNNPRDTLRKIREWKVDISHFLGNRRFLGVTGRKMAHRKRPEEVFVLGEPLTRPHPGVVLARCLLEIGTTYSCVLCGLGNFWNGHAIRLEVDHINGKAWDNRIENLRFLCPNCHSQTPTNCNKNTKYKNASGAGEIIPKIVREKGYYSRNTDKNAHVSIDKVAVPRECAECGRRSRGVRCRACSKENRPTKALWPPLEELKEMLWSESALSVARRLGISSVAVKKRCRKLGIETPPRGYWAKVQAGKTVTPPSVRATSSTSP